MQIVIRPGSTIGNYDADEDDAYLFEGFVRLPQFEDLIDFDNPKCLIIGRTGAGKTALIRYLQRTMDNVLRFDPRQIAMDHIANSDIISFFETLRVDLHLFYELLWKHVICVALIKRIFAITDERTEASWFDKVKAQFGADQGKLECLEYLRNWGKSFWIDTDVQIKEILSKMESQLKSGAQIGLPDLRFTVEYANKLDEQQREQIVQRARKIVSDIQIGKLNQVLDILEHNLEQNRQRKFFVCIDNLDERWVDVSIQFKLIRALIETVRTFRKVHQLKIVISLRSDIFERAMAETRDLGFQREKYQAYIIRLKWKESDLMTLVNKRINILYKNKYTRANIGFSDVFGDKVRNDVTFRYLVERTLYRPRDIIAFVNHCFEAAEGQSTISAKIIQRAENQYSRRRFEALIEEWQSVHPEIEMLLNFLKSKGEKVALETIDTREVVDEIVTQILAGTYSFQDTLINLSRIYFQEEKWTLISPIAFEVFSILYKVGAVGLKLGRQQPYQFSYKDDPVVPGGQINTETEARVHPMLWRALGVTPNI